MKKEIYHAPEAELAKMWAQSLICDSMTGGVEDYDLVGGYTWQD